MKPPDNRVVPLCRKHHTEQHAVGEKTFWSKLDIDPLKLASDIYRKGTIAASVIIKRARIGAGVLPA